MAKKKRKRYSSSSSSGSSSSGSSSSSSSSSSTNSTHSDTKTPGDIPAKPKPTLATESMDSMAKTMFMETKPEELIDQIFIILDEAEIKDLCPALIKHMSISELKEKALKCVINLDEQGLQDIYENQLVDPNTEEIDRALLQLGLVGTKVLERDVNKWKTVAEASKDSDEEVEDEGEGNSKRDEDASIDAIFDESAKDEEQTAVLPKRMKLEEASQESVDEAEQWRALLLMDRVRLSEKLESSSVIARNLSDKPKDYVPEETPVRRDGGEEDSRHTTPPSPTTKSDSGDDIPIGNPPLAPIGNPPLVEKSDTAPVKSYRQRAVEAAAADMDPDAINPDDISSLHSSDDSESSSSSEEGEISDDDDDDGKDDDKQDDGSEKEEGSRVIGNAGTEVKSVSASSDDEDRKDADKPSSVGDEEVDESVDNYAL